MKDINFLAMAKLADDPQDGRGMSLRELLQVSGWDDRDLPASLVVPSESKEVEPASERDLDFLLLLLRAR